MNKPPEPKSKRAILEKLKLSGATSAQMIATELGITPMAVRQHLYALQDESMVTAVSQPSGRGRPTKLWSLTETAQRAFPDAHQELAVDLLKSVESLFGREGLTKVIDRHSATQLKTYSAAMADDSSLESRLQTLAGLRSEDGYMAEVQRDGECWLLMENNCPVCSAARVCTNLCANELGLFQTLLGNNVSIRRDEHIIAGARRCLYRIEQL